MDGTMTEADGLSLARHVPRLALDWIVDSPDDRWRLVDGTMVFADISGFTALSERLATRGRIGAEELVETLSRVFGAMLDTAAGRGGQLLKFGGDALLFLFTGDDHVRQACSTAVEMRAGLRRASDVVTSVGRLSLSISIGVHAGEFHGFLVGAPHRELVVLGPGTTAVVGAENAASAGEIVVSPATAARLPSRAVRARADGQLLLRWRKPPVEPVGPLPTLPSDRASARLLFPALLADQLDDEHPDPAHRVASVAFFRFSGTDAILAEHGPDELAARLHDTLAIAQSAFVDEDIALLCVDCDVDAGKIFCTAGVPVTSEDDEGRLLRAARAILDASPPLPLQVGINRGHVFAAELGTPRRAAYSAMGDTTNTAARICGKAAKGEILVHPDVLEHSRIVYEAEPVGPFTFKGKALPQMLYRLGDELGTRADDRSDELPLVGRADEVGRVRDVLSRLERGLGGAVELTGPVGVGKSRIVAEAIDSIEGVTVLSAHAEPYGAANAFRVFRDPFRAMLGVERGSQRQMRRQLTSAIRRLAPEHAPMLALLADVLQVEVDPSPEVQAIQPQYRPDRTADVVIDVLDAVHPGAIVLVVEDAHWADDPSGHLVRRLAQAARRRPWVVVTTRRDEVGGAELGEIATHVRVEPMPPDEIRRLTILATEAAPLRPHEVDQIVERAGGNPLFVGELVRALQEVGSLDAVPTSLQGAMAAQVDALDPLAKRVLSYASVLGRSFRREVLREVLRAEEMLVDDATVERLGRFLDADGDLRWRFRNGLLRDVVYDGLGFHLRARLHLQAGEAVERISSDTAADADTLALHFAAGADHRRAYRYALLAAERSERSYATATAAAQLEQAIESARRVEGVPPTELRDLWIRLGAARDQAGLLDDALDAFRRARQIPADALSDAQLLLRRAQVRERAGRFIVALRETTSARRLVDPTDGGAGAVVHARASALAATLRQRQERASEALSLALEAVAAAEACGDRDALARACSVVSWAGLVLGRDDSLEYGRRALELYEELDDPVGQAHMANNLGGFAYYRGDWEETVELYQRCVDACRRAGNITDVHLASANIGEVLVSQGRLDEAEPLLRDSARVMRASGHMWGAVFAEMHLGRLLTARGDLDPAEMILRRCVDDNRRLGSAEWVYESAIHLGDCLVAQGRPDEALAEMEAAAAATNDDVSMFEAAAACVRARALEALGRRDEAAGEISRGVAAARSRELEFDLARLLDLAASLDLDAAATGSSEPAVEARRLFDRLGVVSLAFS